MFCIGFVRFMSLLTASNFLCNPFMAEIIENGVTHTTWCTTLMVCGLNKKLNG